MMTKPKSPHPQSLFTTPKRAALDVLYITIGSILCTIAINGILLPKGFVTGGITGISILIHQQIPSVSLGLIYIMCNVPLFVLAWMTVGRRFFFYSIVGALSLALAVEFIHVQINLDDTLLCAVLAAILGGAGIGITLRSSGSQGGMDILAIMLLKRFSISIGTTILMVNCFVLLLVALFKSLDAALYTLIVIYLSAKVIALVVTGLSQRKSVFIISSKWQQISKEILKDIRRGVTIIEGKGGFSGKQEHILYTVITLREIGQLKRVIQHLDPDAFVVISNTLEVMNYRIGNQPHW